MSGNADDEMRITEEFFVRTNQLIPTYNAMMGRMQKMGEDFNFDLFESSVDNLSGIEKGIQSALSSEDVTDISAQFSSMREGIWRINTTLEANTGINNLADLYSNNISYIISMNNNLGLIAQYTGDTYEILKKVTTKGSSHTVNTN